MSPLRLIFYVVFGVMESPSSTVGLSFFFLRRTSNSIASKAKRSNSIADSAIVLSGVFVWGS